MLAKKAKSSKTVETVRERGREPNLNQLCLVKLAKKSNKNRDANSNKTAKNISNIVKNAAFDAINLYKMNDTKDRLECSRFDKKINLLLNSLSFL